MTPRLVVSARDNFLNQTTFSGTVALTIANNPGNPLGTLSGGGAVTAVNGIATFSAVSINKTGIGYTLRANSPSQPSLRPDTSTAFNITSGPATHLGFTAQPSDEGATVAISPPIVVAGLDANDNIATSFTGVVSMAITPGTGTTGALLGGNTAVAAASGQAQFANLSINLVGTGYTLTASATGLGQVASVPFNITSVGNTRLIFTTQPTNTQAGQVINNPTGVRVTAQDSLGNTVTSFTGNVTVAITAGTGAPGAILNGTKTVAAVSGVATFTTLSINEAGTGYTLTATAPSTVAGASATFNITPGPAVSLHYTGQPSTTAAGAQIAPAVVVTARDALGNTATSFTGLVSTTIASGPVGGAFTISATPNVNAVAGVATFSNLRLNRPGSYTLQASSGALTPDTTAAFTVTSTATQLAFTVQPVTSQAGIAMPTVEVRGQDSLGNTAPGFTGLVRVLFSNNPNGAILSGTTQVNAIAGVATFSNLLVDTVGVGYTFLTTSGALSPDESTPFNIIPGPPSVLAFTVQPSNTPAGSVIAPPVRVTVKDNQGNTVTGFSGTVELAITPGTGTAGAVLSGTLSRLVTSGVADFNDLSINLAGNGYQLQATSAGVVGAFNSNAFSITGGMATQLIFTIQPANSTAGIPINPAVQVTARDALGNTASFSGTVTITIASGPVGGGLTPSSTPAVNAVGGVANFTNLRLNKTGTPYTLQATSGALSTTSTGFSVAPGGVSSSLSTVSVSPGSVTASNGASQSTITVTARDTLGNLIPNANVVFSATGLGNTITPSDITDGVGVATGTLSSTATGTKTVSVTIGGVAITQTQPVTVTPDVVSPTTSTMTRLPTTIAASTGSATSTMTVTARDQFSNVIPNANVVFGATGSGNTLNPNPPAGALTNISGVATGTLSSTVSELKVGSATVNGTTITPTVNITVFAAAPKLLQFIVQPNATAAGAIIRPGTGVTVEVRDTFNNRVTTASNPVNIGILFNAGPGGILSGTTTATIPNGRLAGGVATFNDLSIDKTGTNYTLLSSSAGLTADTSAEFPITAGGVSASQSTVSAAPTTITASTGSSTSTITVTVRDGLGNPVQGATVVLSATPITGNTLTQPVGTTNASGVVTGTLSSTKAELKTVSATAQVGAGPIVSITQTASVTVNPAGVSNSQSSVSAAPTSIPASSGSSTSTITVTVRDAFANPIPGATVVLSATPITGNTINQPAGTTNASGVATGTFSSTQAEGKTVSATAQVGAGPIVAITQTAAVTVTSGGPSAAQSTVSAAPTTITASTGSSASTITVTVRDALGNPIQGATVVLSASPITGNALTQPSGTTNASGVATGTLSSTEAELKTVSATAQVGAGPIVSITQTAGVTVNPAAPSASQSSVGAAPTTITASTGSSTSTITVTVRDAFANPIQGATVVLSANPTTGNALMQPSGTTDASGVATGTLSSTEAELKTVSATAQVGAGPVVAIIQTAGVTVNPAGVSNSQSSVSAAPPTITASNGSSSSTITVTVRDAFANPIQGATVVLSATPITGNALTQPGGTTNASGVATGTLSSTEAELKTVSATAQVGAGPIVSITQTAGVTVNPAAPSAAQSSVSAAPGTITASNGSSTATITVTVRDAFDNLIQGAAVVLSSTGSNNVFVQPGNTNASGVTSGTFRSTTAEGKTISATAQVGA
ncbi:MAG TPA: Ig-like domain-containing protein, partial [Gemmatimonadales bacterium]